MEGGTVGCVGCVPWPFLLRFVGKPVVLTTRARWVLSFEMTKRSCAAGHHILGMVDKVVLCLFLPRTKLTRESGGMHARNPMA